MHINGMDARPSLPPDQTCLPPSRGGWRTPRGEPSLADMFGSVRVVRSGSFWRKLAAFLGPGYLVAVGYMDPGNWATSLAGGSKFGYALLTVALPNPITRNPAKPGPGLRRLANIIERRAARAGGYVGCLE